MAAEAPENFSDEGGPISSINVTPFVDVVLVLLVIFMATAPALIKDSLGIHLPKAATGDQKGAQTLGIVVTKEGRILVNGQLATPETVALEVKQALISNPEVQALISADEDARHGDVVRAIDLVRTAGLSRFGLQIEKPE